MSTRDLVKLPTAGGKVFWTDVVNRDGWRVQYNKTLDKVTPLKPFRLLDPQDYLCASANTVEEMAQALPRLIAKYEKKKPVVTHEQVKDALLNIATVLLQAAAGGKGGGGKKVRARRR
jgi:hypothetical protein